jgi:peptidyl-prolyl cis-trans isomerase SurA
MIMTLIGRRMAWPSVGYCLALWLGTAVLTAQETAPRNHKDGILAIVNDQVITAFDVIAFTAAREQRTLSRYSTKDLSDQAIREQYLQEVREERRRVANRLIDQELLYDEFLRKGYTVPNDLVLREMDGIVARQTNGNYEKFYEALGEQKLSAEEFRDQIRKGLAVKLLLHNELDRKVIVSPLEIHNYYEQHRNEFGQSGQLHVQMIFLRSGKDQAARVATVSEALAKGEDFGALAGKYTEGPFKEQGGDLGWMDASKIRPEFQQALNSVASGGVTPPIRLDEATVFLRKVEEKPMQVASYEESSERIRAFLFQQERDRRYETMLERLRAKAYIRKFFPQ